MKIGLVGPTSQQISLPFDAQRLVNGFAIMDQQGKEVASLLGTPGLFQFSSGGTGPLREMFRAGNGRCFFVSGSQVYELFANASITLRGSINKSTGIVYMEENQAGQLGICDGRQLYIYKYSDNSFVNVSTLGTGLPASVGSLTYKDGFFIVNQNGTNHFFKSAPNDGLNWAALDFASAQNSPDLLLRPIQAVGQLWLMGSTHGEIWTNTGAALFPFQKISGGNITMGILAPKTAIECDNTLFWVGADKYGSGMVCRANGFIPKVISTEAIGIAIGKATDKTNIRAWVYQEDKHVFYVLTGGGLQTSLVYDVTTDQWHERAYLNSQGNFEQHLGACYANAFGLHLVGDRNSNKIYVMDTNTYSDNGNPLKFLRTYTHIASEDKRIRYNRLVVGVETGVGLQSGQGVDPVVMLRLSKDGARTYSGIYPMKIGKAGKYLNKASSRRLGVAQQMTFEISITDPVKRALTGSYLA